MNIFPFLNSRAIADHWREIGFEPTAEQVAFLIHQSRERTLAEKRAAYREIIAAMPDVSLPERTWCPAVPSLHTFLADFIDVEEQLLTAFLDPNDGVYSFVGYSNSVWSGCDSDPLVYPTFESCLEKLCDTSRYDPLIRAEVTRQKFGSVEPLLRNCVCVSLDADLKIVSIKDYDSKSRYSKAEDFFSSRWFAFPMPFSRGDIVCSPNISHSQIGCESFVLDELACWGSKELLANGIPEKSKNGKSYYKWKDRWIERAAAETDSTDMTASGIFYNDDGTIYGEVMHDYLDLDYPKEKPDGAGRILIPISNFLKGKIDEVELIRATQTIGMQLFLERTTPTEFTEEGLRLMGLKKQEGKP